MITILAVASGLSHIAFMIIYNATAKWEDSPEGSATMLGSLSFLMLCASIALGSLFPNTVWALLLSVSLVMAGLSGLARTVLVLHRQGIIKLNDRSDK